MCEKLNQLNIPQLLGYPAVCVKHGRIKVCLPTFTFTTSNDENIFLKDRMENNYEFQYFQFIRVPDQTCFYFIAVVPRQKRETFSLQFGYPH